MTPCFTCKYLVRGNSTNHGAFEEPGSISIRRYPDQSWTEEQLVAEFKKGAIDSFNNVAPRRKPKYEGVSKLQVILGPIETIDEDTVRPPEDLPWVNRADA